MVTSRIVVDGSVAVVSVNIVVEPTCSLWGAGSLVVVVVATTGCVVGISTNTEVVGISTDTDVVDGSVVSGKVVVGASLVVVDSCSVVGGRLVVGWTVVEGSGSVVVGAT